MIDREQTMFQPPSRLPEAEKSSSTEASRGGSSEKIGYKFLLFRQATLPPGKVKVEATQISRADGRFVEK